MNLTQDCRNCRGKAIADLMIVISMLFVFLEKLCIVAFAKAGEIDEYRRMKMREDVQDDLTGHLR